MIYKGSLFSQLNVESGSMLTVHDDKHVLRSLSDHYSISTGINSLKPQDFSARFKHFFFKIAVQKNI